MVISAMSDTTDEQAIALFFWLEGAICQCMILSA
jgi:hypothetical protein